MLREIRLHDVDTVRIAAPVDEEHLPFWVARTSEVGGPINGNFDARILAQYGDGLSLFVLKGLHYWGDAFPVGGWERQIDFAKRSLKKVKGVESIDSLSIISVMRRSDDTDHLGALIFTPGSTRAGVRAPGAFDWHWAPTEARDNDVAALHDLAFA